MRRVRNLGVVGACAALVACGEATPTTTAQGVRLEVVADVTAPGATAVALSVVEGAAPHPLAAGECSRARAEGRALSPATALEAELTSSIELGWSAAANRHTAVVPQVAQDLAWQPVRLHGAGPGGWLVDEASAAQVPEAPRVLAAEVLRDGGVAVHFRPGDRSPTALVVEKAGETWRCGVGEDHGVVPWWLAEGRLDEVRVERTRVEEHHTRDGVPVVGVASVRVPAVAAIQVAPPRARPVTVSGHDGPRPRVRRRRSSRPA